jgi:GntR family transcriptional regulator/MocR family aminotransferase
MLPTLRLGFIVAPEWAMRTLVAAKNCLDWHCSTPTQLGVAAFIAEGHLTHHVRKMRRVYKQRRQLLLNYLTEELGEWLEPIPSFYGMHVGAMARTSRNLDLVTDVLSQSNIKLHAFRRYYFGPQTNDGLIFGYGAADLPQLKLGLSALRKVLRG